MYKHLPSPFEVSNVKIPHPAYGKIATPLSFPGRIIRLGDVVVLSESPGSFYLVSGILRQTEHLELFPLRLPQDVDCLKHATEPCEYLLCTPPVFAHASSVSGEAPIVSLLEFSEKLHRGYFCRIAVKETLKLHHMELPPAKNWLTHIKESKTPAAFPGYNTLITGIGNATRRLLEIRGFGRTKKKSTVIPGITFEVFASLVRPEHQVQRNGTLYKIISTSMEDLGLGPSHVDCGRGIAHCEGKVAVVYSLNRPSQVRVSIQGVSLRSSDGTKLWDSLDPVPKDLPARFGFDLGFEFESEDDDDDQ